MADPPPADALEKWKAVSRWIIGSPRSCHPPTLRIIPQGVKGFGGFRTNGQHVNAGSHVRPIGALVANMGRKSQGSAPWGKSM